MLRRNRLLLSAGLLPLPWFLFWTSVAAVFAPGYNALAQHASELLHAPTLASICGRIAAIGSGMGFVAFSIGVWRESGRRIAVGAICWLVFGISMLTNGLWPMGHPMHGFYTIGIANIIAPAMSHIELSAWSANRRAYSVTTAMSVASIVYLVERGGSGPGGLPGADPARVLVDQLAVAIPGGAVSGAKRLKRAEGAACALMGGHAGTWTTIERVGLRRG